MFPVTYIIAVTSLFVKWWLLLIYFQALNTSCCNISRFTCVYMFLVVVSLLCPNTPLIHNPCISFSKLLVAKVRFLLCIVKSCKTFLFSPALQASFLSFYILLWFHNLSGLTIYLPLKGLEHYYAWFCFRWYYVNFSSLFYNIIILYFYPLPISYRSFKPSNNYI